MTHFVSSLFSTLRWMHFSSLIMAFAVAGCGVKKDVNGGTGNPPSLKFYPREKTAADPTSLWAKTEDINLTSQNQELQPNVLWAPQMATYTRVQKIFRVPIQFNGWISLDHVTPVYKDCGADSTGMVPRFTFLEEPNGKIEMVPGQRYPVKLEKISAVRLDLANDAGCKDVNVQFVIFYGEGE
jgi:hypothetical protein